MLGCHGTDLLCRSRSFPWQIHQQIVKTEVDNSRTTVYWRKTHCYRAWRLVSKLRFSGINNQEWLVDREPWQRYLLRHPPRPEHHCRVLRWPGIRSRDPARLRYCFSQRRRYRPRDHARPGPEDHPRHLRTHRVRRNGACWRAACRRHYCHVLRRRGPVRGRAGRPGSGVHPEHACGDGSHGVLQVHAQGNVRCNGAKTL
mmetsp:Transcript_49483/g.130325  ORF Transcript_49483/g.130325 Transcript_49483/m.130325 type:complete len:200 (+) Transcript_49483:213-812(+)